MMAGRFPEDRLPACLPEHWHGGPAVLVAARLFQGVSVGGEYGVSPAYISELALPG